MSDRAERRRLAREAIAAHLAKHPAGCDTAEGICRWWLNAGTRGEDVSVVEEALEELVAAGTMRRRVLPDGGVVFFATPRITR